MPQARPSEASPLRAAPVAGRLRCKPRLSSRIIEIDHPLRRRAERFVEGVYARSYGGCIPAHYPTLMGVQDDDGEIHAVVGFRLAEQGPLFLEHYLDAPIERVLADCLEAGAERSRIAEIGNLGSRSPAATLFLFRALTGRLRFLGREVAVATATRELRSILGKVGVAAIELTAADPGRLPDRGATWGSYYSTDPRVMAGSIGAWSGRARTAISSRLHLRSIES